MPKQKTALAFDIGGTKIAWGIVTEEGEVTKHGRVETPHEKDEFLAAIDKIVRAHPADAVGIGMAGTFDSNHKTLLVSPNAPGLRDIPLHDFVTELANVPVALDNDARCALIGEVWKGGAQDTSSAVLITLGTGVGGAVMQRQIVLSHPNDISQEISHIVADTSDLFPAISGRGTIEAMIGGRNLEKRFECSLAELSTAARKHDKDALEIWDIIAYYFSECVQAIYSTYSCKLILVGGRGAHDLEFYMEGEMPCPIAAATLGEQAALVGAARLAFDAIENVEAEVARGWDE